MAISNDSESQPKAEPSHPAQLTKFIADHPSAYYLDDAFGATGCSQASTTPAKPVQHEVVTQWLKALEKEFGESYGDDHPVVEFINDSFNNVNKFLQDLRSGQAATKSMDLIRRFLFKLIDFTDFNAEFEAELYSNASKEVNCNEFSSDILGFINENSEDGHCVMIASSHGEVLLYDSDIPGYSTDVQASLKSYVPTNRVQIALYDKYKKLRNDGILEFWVVDCPQQPSQFKCCTLYAVANMVHFLLSQKFPKKFKRPEEVCYKLSEMGNHYLRLIKLANEYRYGTTILDERLAEQLAFPTEDCSRGHFPNFRRTISINFKVE